MAKKASTKKNKASPEEVHIVVRFIIAAILFIVGILISNSPFFKENPLFGVEFFAEAAISLVAALLGFFIIPQWFVYVKYWFERLITKVVSDAVTDFWEQQAKKREEQKRQKALDQKARAKKEEEEKRLQEKLKKGILLDTSVLIDGRILDVAKLSFLEGPLVVPQAVLDELHLLSDSRDDLKRKRGRRGLDVLKDLRKRIKVEVIDNMIPEKKKGADKILVGIAKKYKIRLMTLDFNLNKVASVSGVKVLNLNKLSQALRAIVLPGEKFKISVVHEGKGKGQGVGYLEDGTMVVVKGASKLLGDEVEVEVTKNLESEAGRMIFGTLISN